MTYQTLEQAILSVSAYAVQPCDSLVEHERRVERFPFKATSPLSLAKSSLRPPGLLRRSTQLQRQFSLISTHRTLGINEKLFQRWQSSNVAWAHQQWHRFGFFHNISFTRVAHKQSLRQITIWLKEYISDGLQEFTSTSQLFVELEIPLYSLCCFLPEERLQRRDSQRRFDYLMGKIRRCGAAGPCRCIDVEKKAQGAWKRGKNNCDDFAMNWWTRVNFHAFQKHSNKAFE